MNEYYYGIKADKIITPFGFVQMKLNDKPIEFIYKQDSHEWNGTCYIFFRLYVDLAKYKIHDEIICTIDNRIFEHFYSDEYFSSAYIENKDYFLAVGVYDSEENGYHPPFEHCFESYDCDNGASAWVFDNPRNYRENYTRYFRTTIAWLPKSIDGYDDIIDVLIDNFPINQSTK